MAAAQDKMPMPPGQQALPGHRLGTSGVHYRLQ
jgi:hypothetical protein